MNETHSIYNIKYMCRNLFKKIEHAIDVILTDNINKSMDNYLDEEIQQAKIENNYDEGIPAISSVGDY